MSLNSKNKKYTSGFAGIITDTSSSTKQKESETEKSSSKSKKDDDGKTGSRKSKDTYDMDEKKESSKSSKSRDKESKKRDDNEVENDRDKEKDRKSRTNRSQKDDKDDRDRERDKSEKSRHKSRTKEDDADNDNETKKSSRKSHSRKKDDDDGDKNGYEAEKQKESSSSKSNHRSSKHRDKSRHDDDDDERHKSKDKNRHKKKDDSDKEDKYEEPNYDDDFENDFEKDSEEEEKKPSKTKSKSKSYDSDEDQRDSRKSKEKSKSSKKYQDYDDDDAYDENRRRNNRNNYDDEDMYGRGKIVKANALVKLPTELVEVYSSTIHYNHDSIDRHKRRAKDLFKKSIELDKKAFTLLDINPVQMRTVYSSHLKHEKVQTNDDTLEIEVQTDEIEMATRWTQHPPDDLKGYGIENEKYIQEESADILEKFRVDLNIENLSNFLRKSSKVIETLLKEASPSDDRKYLTENKSDLEFSQGYSIFSMSKVSSKLAKVSTITNCVFSTDNSNSIVCSYMSDVSSTSQNTTLLIVWNIEEPNEPYRILSCEAQSTCLNYFSYFVVSGNVDGSIVLWDLRESSSLHSYNVPKKKESHVIRSPTYTTAGILQEENHLSEVRSILNLQAQAKEDEKGVFMQLASLEIDCKLIIWTIVELPNLDMAVFETDLGLLPGGKIQLVKSFEINLNNTINSIFGKCEYQTWNMTTSTDKKNHFFISTNIGQIIHVARKGESFSTTIMKLDCSEVYSIDGPGKLDGPDTSDGLLNVTNVCFHHEISSILLAGYGNGELRLYHVDYATPIKTWHFMMGVKLKEVKWIGTRSSCFVVLDENRKLVLWDLLADDTKPILVKKFQNFGNINFPTIRARTNDSTENNNNTNKPGEGKVPFAFYNAESSDLEIHLFNSDWVKQSDKESKKFAKLIKNYLISF